MPKGICKKVGCTVAETGICLLSHDHPESDCPEFQAIPTEEVEEPKRPEKIEPSDDESISYPAKSARQFHIGLELGSEDATEIARARYSHLVGILGSFDAGKTCFLLSLYLMASGGALPPDYAFAGSLTLKGFEERARRLRQWKGGALPGQLADHTSLADPRQPGLLHLAFRDTKDFKQRSDVMLTDLPGEWSKSLIDSSAAADRFKFLNRADGIIIVVDGPSLTSVGRHIELARTKILMERLTSSVGIDPCVPLTILLTKCDEIEMKRPDLVDDVIEHGSKLGFQPRVVLSAAFSRTPDLVPNGVGVFDALEPILKHQLANTVSRETVALPTGGRVFTNFGSQSV